MLFSSSLGSCIRNFGLIYAVAAFIGTWVFFTWFVIFLGNLPKLESPWIAPSIDVSEVGATADPFAAALANCALLALFCFHHSLMARPRFKRALARVLPPALERATYVHVANLTGFLFLWLWTPIPQPLWTIENDVAKALVWIGFGIGWLILLLAALSIDVMQLLGIRQAWAWYRGRTPEPLTLRTSWLYSYIEHPMYVGVLLGFWMTPHMSVGHALLASQLTLYIAIAMSFERRDLEQRFGTAYRRWRAVDHPRWDYHVSGEIARELQRRFQPVVSEPLPRLMIALLRRL